MEILAGRSVPNVTERVIAELQAAGIPHFFDPEHDDRFTEVYTNARGVLTIEDRSFIFKRAWYYWTVNGPVPMEIAKRMYENPIGKKDVRVAGHCGCTGRIGSTVRP